MTLHSSRRGAHAGGKSTKRGGPRMKERGYKQLTLWFDPSEWEKVRAASKAMGIRPATFARVAACADAMRALKGGAS